MIIIIILFILYTLVSYCIVYRNVTLSENDAILYYNDLEKSLKGYERPPREIIESYYNLIYDHGIDNPYGVHKVSIYNFNTVVFLRAVRKQRWQPDCIRFRDVRRIIRF